METNQSILTREVVAIDDRKKLGKLKDLCVDCDSNAVSHYIINNPKTNSSLVLPFGKSLAVGDTFMTIQSRNDVLSTTDRQTNAIVEDGFRLVDVEVYSRTGNRLGVVKGYEFDPVFGTVTKITLDQGGEFDADSFVFFAEDFVFVNDGAATAAELRSGTADQASEQVSSYAEDDTEVAEEQGAEEFEELAAENEVSEEAEVAVEASEEASEGAGESEDEVLRKFLIGAVLNDDVESKDGAFKVSKGTELTEEMINEAQEHDALLLLTMSVEA